MDSSDRTYRMAEIREERRVAALLLALQQRRLDALAKMDEASDELEQAERELAALMRGETQPGQPAETVTPEPRTIGERTLKILEDHPDAWLTVRDVLTGMDERGWLDTDPKHAMQRLRHCLPRLVRANEHVECDQDDMTHRYRARSRMDGYALVAVPHANGAAYPALQGGHNDG
jgi:hypothetical protein